MGITKLFSLFIYVLVISFTHEIQESDELYEQIAILNKKIAPIAKLATALPNTLNSLAAGSLFARGLNGRIDRRQQLSGLLSQTFLKLAPLLGLNQGTEISEAVQELTKYLTLNGNVANNLANFKPFIPATDSNGDLSCLKNASLKDLCLEDTSYPKWYTTLIAPAVEETISTVLSKSNDVNPCINPPRKQCNGTYGTDGSLETGKREGDSAENSTYNFLLQTKTLQQTFSVRKCTDIAETCDDPAKPDPVRCESVTDGPSFGIGRRSTTLQKSLVINASGFVELADMSSVEFLCWCKCMKSGDGYVGTE